MVTPIEQNYPSFPALHQVSLITKTQENILLLLLQLIGL